MRLVFPELQMLLIETVELGTELFPLPNAVANLRGVRDVGGGKPRSEMRRESVDDRSK
jgi:hypothetical protein